MGGDLGIGEPQVHDDAELRAQARRVIDFWFGLDPQQHWEKDAALDADIAERFGDIRRRVLVTGADGWRDHPDTMLAAIILLDQFSRNIHRGSAKAFEADDLAASLTMEALARGYDQRLPPEQRVFLQMPLMHAEDGPLQAKSVEEFEKLGIEDNAQFARDHRDVFTRFGRFPGRNAALGRDTTEEEAVWLKDNDGGW